MKIISCSVRNFSSYKELDFNFDSKGLCLVAGPTGAGKSTLCDIISWVLFGKTSKGGAVDEVISWNGDNTAEGTIYLDSNKIVSITRLRSPKGSDLFYEDMTLGRHRGKDLNDTQKLIDNLLGFNYETYLAGAYFHEFSQTAQFFITTAKNRRQITEQLVDLSLAKKLQEKASENTKLCKETISNFSTEIRDLEYKLNHLKTANQQEEKRLARWNEDLLAKRKSLETRYDLFESNRKQIKHNKCNSCGTVFSKPTEVCDNSVNPYLEMITELELAVNPYTGAVKDYTSDLKEVNEKLIKFKNLKDFSSQEYSDLELLSEVIKDFRAVLVKNTILDLETSTNTIIADYFDAEIRVGFEIAEADKLEVSIWKDGNNCSYSQLSKGQRQLLKLAFGVSVMKCVQNHHGIKFNSLFFDESMEGFSEKLKIQSYKLFEKLSQEYSSIFVVEHSQELKALFENQIQVALENGHSVLKES